MNENPFFLAMTSASFEYDFISFLAHRNEKLAVISGCRHRRHQPSSIYIRNIALPDLKRFRRNLVSSCISYNNMCFLPLHSVQCGFARLLPFVVRAAQRGVMNIIIFFVIFTKPWHALVHAINIHMTCL